MRHGKSGKAFGRRTMWRAATVRDIAKSVLIHQRIQTTESRAKEARKLVDRIITMGKEGTLAAKRRAFAILCDHKLVSRLFNEIAKQFKDRAGGYTRIIRLGVNRRGDNASLVLLELTEKIAKETVKPSDKKTSKDKKEPLATDAVIREEAKDKDAVDPKKKESHRDKKDDKKTPRVVREKSAKPASGVIKNIFRNKKPE